MVHYGMRDAAQKQRLEPTPPASSDQDRLRVDLGRGRGREDRVRNASYALLGSGSVAIPSLRARSAPSGSVAKAWLSVTASICCTSTVGET